MDNNQNPLDQAISQANSNQNTTKVTTKPAMPPCSYQEFRDKNGGKVRPNKRPPLKDSEGNEFSPCGILFGQCFAAFSKEIMDNHQGQDFKTIALDVNSNRDQYQVRHTARKNEAGVAEYQYHKDGSPILIVDVYRPMGEVGEEME